jgi:4-amino-4-deoxy-L-arabinose transferase-like glycosyltransferase
VVAQRLSPARLALIGALALAVRLVYVLVIAPAPVGVGGDAGFYHSAANLLANGHFLYRGIFGHAYVTAEHPPLFPVVLSLSSVLGENSLLAHRIVGCLIGSLAVIAIALLARRVAGERAGLIAGLLAAVYPPLVTADGLVMSEPLFVLLVAAGLLAALRLRARGATADASLLGLVIGLATLTRGEGVLLLPLLGWPAAVLAAPQGRLKRVLATAAAALILIAPWMVRNAVVFHRVMFAADANTLVAGANCHDTYYGHDIGWWSLSCLAHGRTRAQLDSGDASTTTALRYARAHPGRLPLVAAVRVLRTFDLFQPLRQGNHEPRRRWVDIAGLILFYPVLLLAIVGAVRVRRDRWILLAPVAMVVIVSALGWGIGRFRVAADVTLLVLASATLARAWRQGEPINRAAAGPARPRRALLRAR